MCNRNSTALKQVKIYSLTQHNDDSVSACLKWDSLERYDGYVTCGHHLHLLARQGRHFAPHRIHDLPEARDIHEVSVAIVTVICIVMVLSFA